MSMFSFPPDLTTNEMMKPMTAMTDWTKTADFKVSPLMVYPLGAAAAMTAIGFGMAGQMTGLMMGAMQGAIRSNSGLLGNHPDMSWILPTLAEDLAPAEDDAAPSQPEPKAKSADVVALKAAGETGAKPARAKTGPSSVKARAASAKPAVSAEPKPAAFDKNVAVLDKLKSDAQAAAAAATETASAPVARTDSAAAKMEPEDFRRPLEIEKPEAPDDLKAISGIGPKLEQVLNGLGVWSFAQIAAWRPEEVAWVDDYLQFSGRIDRDNWISQADALARSGKAAG